MSFNALNGSRTIHTHFQIHLLSFHKSGGFKEPVDYCLNKLFCCCLFFPISLPAYWKKQTTTKNSLFSHSFNKWDATSPVSILYTHFQIHLLSFLNFQMLKYMFNYMFLIIYLLHLLEFLR